MAKFRRVCVTESGTLCTNSSSSVVDEDLVDDTVSALTWEEKLQEDLEQEMASPLVAACQDDVGEVGDNTACTLTTSRKVTTTDGYGMSVSRDDEDVFGSIGLDFCIEDAIPLNKADFLGHLSRLHGQVARVTSEIADAKSKYLLAKAAREASLASAKWGARKWLASEGKVTENMVSERALQSNDYQSSLRLEIEAEKEFERGRGIIQALLTKRDMIRSAAFMLAPEAHLASSHVGYGDDLSEITDNVDIPKVSRKKKE